MPAEIMTKMNGRKVDEKGTRAAFSVRGNLQAIAAKAGSSLSRSPVGSSSL